MILFSIVLFYRQRRKQKQLAKKQKMQKEEEGNNWQINETVVFFPFCFNSLEEGAWGVEWGIEKCM